MLRKQAQRGLVTCPKSHNLQFVEVWVSDIHQMKEFNLFYFQITHFILWQALQKFSVSFI